MGNSKSRTSSLPVNQSDKKRRQKRLQRSVQKSQRHHQENGSTPAFVESGDGASCHSGVSRGRTTPGKQETREERREERGKVEERRVGAMPADRSKSKGEETEKTSTPKPCVAMSFQLMSNLPSGDMAMIKDAASYSTSSYVSLTDSFEDNSFSDDEILFPLSRHFQDVTKDGYGEAVFFKHIPEPRVTSRDMNMDVFRAIKKSQAAKQQNAQLHKIAIAKAEADKGGEKEKGAMEGETKQYELKIKGFAKSLPKVIEGGTIVSTPGWREKIAKRKSKSNHPPQTSRSKSAPHIFDKTNSVASLVHGKNYAPASFDNSTTKTEVTYESIRMKDPRNTLSAVLDMLNCTGQGNEVDLCNKKFQKNVTREAEYAMKECEA